MKITVIGAGYVGLVAAVCFAQGGHQVICLERDEQRCRTLENGQCPILEEGLPPKLDSALSKGYLQFTTDSETAIPWGEFVFITVGTPEGEDGQPDLRALQSVISSIGQHGRDGQIVVIKSTVPPGTTQMIGQAICADRFCAGYSGAPQVICNPEFLREGTAVSDFLSPDRVVVGAENRAAGEALCALYRPLLQTSAPIVLTSSLNAELVKYASNSYLAVRLSYINELAALCEKLGADINEVAQAMGLDHRIGHSYLSAGLGYGGSCLPKDTQALAHMARKAGAPLTVLEHAMTANQNIANRLAERVTSAVQPGGIIAVWGMSFKAGTEDTRCSPIFSLMTAISQRMDCKFQIFDPASRMIEVQYPQTVSGLLSRTPEESLNGADALIVATAWPQFQQIDMNLLSAHMRGRTIFDFVNVLDRSTVQRAGFNYYGCGRQESTLSNFY